jgi:hypothetical protein
VGICDERFHKRPENNFLLWREKEREKEREQYVLV